MFVKICGITNEEDALLATALGADAVGFVFAPSTRQIQPVQAYDIVRRLPPDVLTVGVFRDHAPQRVVGIMHQVGLKAAQLHGHESVEDVRFVRERVALVIKAFPAGSSALSTVDRYPVDAILVDSATPGSREVIDWALAEGAPLGRRVILAGGLTADNVGAAIARVRPWGVDVSSGVEHVPGKKDARKMRAFIEAVRAATPAAYEGDELTPYDWQEDDI